LSEVQKNDNAAYLPGSAESTKVDKEVQQFDPIQTIPGFLVYQRTSGLTEEDLAKINSDVQKLRALDGVAGDQVSGPQLSKDRTVASVTVPLIAKNGDKEVDGEQLSKVEKQVIAIGKSGNPDGLVVHSAGAGGLIVAFIDSFQGIDGKLIAIAGLVVVVLLLLVYRSPVLWIFPLFSAFLALGLSSLIIYFLAKNEIITLNGQSQGIMSVLVIGAGTDYALLLISRYREELHEYRSRIDAMTRAWRGAGHCRVQRHRDPRAALPGRQRTELQPRPGTGVRHRHHLHGGGYVDVPAGGPGTGRTLDLLAAHAARGPSGGYRHARLLGPGLALGRRARPAQLDHRHRRVAGHGRLHRHIEGHRPNHARQLHHDAGCRGRAEDLQREVQPGHRHTRGHHR
jgi:MMPL family